ncbi:MAG TPA: ATP-binding protein [Candidatus Paceibacterota bacterium]|nr:ATP-binding protein [Candidatus Paceibacterota bacterium]
MQTNWYAIAGGVCSGKTTVIEELKKRGYTIVPEAAREIIDEGLAEGKTLEEVRGDVLAFQRQILARFGQKEGALARDEIAFFDRGRPDARAFLAFNALPEPLDVTREVEGAAYKKVFMLAPLTHIPEYYRTERPEEIEHLHEHHVRAYESLPLVIQHVPVMSVSERVDFIVRNL